MGISRSCAREREIWGKQKCCRILSLVSRAGQGREIELYAFARDADNAAPFTMIETRECRVSALALRPEYELIPFTHRMPRSCPDMEVDLGRVLRRPACC